ncbi:hypothetical protein [Actinoplanes philippinensis]|uniref:hypothetical protein n=1 Tax=Actinoplanes philippinensis TaxID=35752 RepID=UPI0033CD3FE5
MDDQPQLQLFEIKELSPTSLRCTVRCVAGTVRLGATVELRPVAGRPVAGNLTVTAIEYAGGVVMEFVDLGRTALVTVTGPIDEVALRTVAAGDGPEQVAAVDLRLVVR